MEQEIIFEKLRKILGEIFSVDPNEITMDTAFVREFGADSMDFLQIFIRIEEEFDVDITREEIKSTVTTADFVKKIIDT